MVVDYRYSSNKPSCLTINSSFLVRVNPETRVLHKLTVAGITAFALYVIEKGVSPVDLQGVVLYAHKTLCNSLAHLPLASSSLFCNSFTIALLVASA